MNILEKPERANRFGSGSLLGGVPMLTLKDGSRVPEYMVCEKCGAHLSISPNSKGAFSYQGCNCNEPEWMQYESAS